MAQQVPDKHVEHNGCIIALRNPAPGVVLSEASGHAGPPIAQALIDFVAVVRPQHKDGMLIFHDWQKVEGYESEARRMLIEAGKADRAETRELHVLTQSQVLAMGISVASMFLPHLKSHRDADEFHTTVRSAISSRGSF